MAWEKRFYCERSAFDIWDKKRGSDTSGDSIVLWLPPFVVVSSATKTDFKVFAVS